MDRKYLEAQRAFETNPDVETLERYAIETIRANVSPVNLAREELERLTLTRTDKSLTMLVMQFIESRRRFRLEGNTLAANAIWLTGPCLENETQEERIAWGLAQTFWNTPKEQLTNVIGYGYTHNGVVWILV